MTAPATPQGPRAAAAASLHDARIQVLHEFADAYNRHDPGAIMRLMADDCEFVSYFGPDPCGERFTGRAAVTQRVIDGLAAFPDAQWLNCVHSVAADRGFSEWTFAATNPDGTTARRDGIDVFVFRGTRIASKSTFQKWVVTDGRAPQ